MLGKHIDDLVADDIHALVRDRAEETQRLEFKREIDVTRDKDKREFAKDVSGMANGAGGRIVYGVQEGSSAGGRPVAEQVVPLTDRTLVERLNSILTNSITPPVRARLRPVDVDGGFAVVVDIPPSDMDLHMVGAYDESRYYLRTEKAVVPMPEVEVRRSYERIGRLRDDADERVRRVIAEEGPPLGQRTMILAIPLAPGRGEVDIVKFNDPNVWMPKDRILANRNQAFDVLINLRPTGRGLEACIPREKPLPEATFAFSLRPDGVLHMGSPLFSPLVTSGKFLVTRLFYDVLNITAWNELVCAASSIRGPSRLVVQVPVSQDMEIGGPPDDIIDPLVLRERVRLVDITYDWTPRVDVNARLEVVQAVFDKLWRYMGRERCDRFFVAPGRLQSRIAADLGISQP